MQRPMSMLQISPVEIQELQLIADACSWEEVSGVLRSDDRRNYNINIQADLPPSPTKTRKKLSGQSRPIRRALWATDRPASGIRLMAGSMARWAARRPAGVAFRRGLGQPRFVGCAPPERRGRRAACTSGLTATLILFCCAAQRRAERAPPSFRPGLFFAGERQHLALRRAIHERSFARRSYAFIA